VPACYLITGPSGSGKTTVARLLAEQFDCAVHLEGDVFRRSIVSGRHDPTPDLAPPELSQLELRYRLAAAAADTYFDAGFTVVLEDVVAGEFLRHVVELVRSRPLHVVVLLPAKEVLAVRDATRGWSGYSRWSIDQLHDGFARSTPRIGLWLDSSEQTPLETVTSILERTSS
jgi:predicted kinase